MLRKIRERCVNYGTMNYLIYGALTMAVDFAVHTVLRNVGIGVGASQALFWLVAVLFVCVVNRLIVFRDYNMRPFYLVREVRTFVAAQAFSGVVTWVLMVVMAKLGGDRGFIYELFCKFTSSAINMVLNHVFSKLWIFKKE